MQRRDGREFDQVDCASARAAGEVRKEPQASVGAFGSRFEQGAESRARNDGARERSSFRLGEKEKRNWLRREASSQRRVKGKDEETHLNTEVTEDTDKSG